MPVGYAKMKVSPISLSLGEETLKSLIDLVDEGTPADQCLAIKALQAWQHPLARETFVKATRNDDPDVRVDALEALRSLNAGDLGDVFFWSLQNDPVGDSKVAAIRGLGPQDRDVAAPLLRKLIQDRCEEEVTWEDEVADWDDWLDIQKEAIRAVGKLGVEDAVSDILAAANDEFGQDLWIEALAAFADLGRSGLMALIDAGQSATELQRKRAARALEASMDSLAVKALDALSQDKSAEVRLAALETAIARKAPLADDRLIKDPSPAIRQFAAAKSPTIGNDDLLELATADGSKQVKLAAISRLSERHPTASQIAALLAHARTKLRSEPEGYVAALIQVLKRAGTSEIFDLLMEIREHNPNPEIQRAVADAMAHFTSPEALEVLEQSVSHRSQMVRLSTLASLAALSSGEGEIADNAAALLYLAARGDLVNAEEENKSGKEEVESEKQFSNRARDDEGGNRNRIVLDREGNVISQKPAEETVNLSDYRKQEDQLDNPEEAIEPETSELPEELEEGATEESAEVVAFPTNTLASILQSDEEQATFQEEKIELSGKDLKFLELAQSTLQKKRVRPDVAPNAALDVQRVSVRLIGEQQHPAFTSALLSCTNATDNELRASAFDAIARRAKQGVSLSEEEWNSLASLPPDNHPPARAAFFGLLAFSPTDVSGPRLQTALTDGETTDRVAALKLCSLLGKVPENLSDHLSSDSRSVRKAAINVAMECDQTEREEDILAAAFRESGALGAELSKGMTSRGACGLNDAILEGLTNACLAGGTRRIIALQVLSQAGSKAMAASA
jgi:HEAT repeat protein